MIQTPEQREKYKSFIFLMSQSSIRPGDDSDWATAWGLLYWL